ncbi:MAG: NAD(P)-binding protein, partial [Myxococcales bacterium]|nr:NAD(P)-binding protein [Myxococcales bacterium]
MLSERAHQPRIAIVGAGPAGLAAAFYLKELGYSDVLVLERMGRAGGLCKSITDGYQVFDLGANYLTAAYEEVHRFAKMVGAETYLAKEYL